MRRGVFGESRSRGGQVVYLVVDKTLTTKLTGDHEHQ